MRKILFSLIACTMLVGQVAIQPYTYAANTYRPKTGHTYISGPTGHTYISGPKGGCYYINKNKNKTYVDRTLCKK